MKQKHSILFILFSLGVVTFSGCQTEEMMSLHNFSSGSYTVDIQTSGGALRSGDNPVSIHVLMEDSPVDISKADLMFSMPAMGGMPYMEMRAEFSKTPGSNELSGNINFNMGGSWTGHVQVHMGGDSLITTFPMRVED